MTKQVSEAPILVTGGGGFLGTALVEWFLREGHNVIRMDIAFPHEVLDTRVEHVLGSVMDTALIEDLVARCSRVYHLAAVVGVDEYIHRPDDVLDVNILGTRTVLNACLRHQKPVLLTSTSETYGKNTNALHEEADRVYGSSANSRWSYAVSKSAGEHYARAYGKRGLNYVIVRYFNAYGPLLDSPGKGRVISKFLGAIQEKRPLTLVDGGEAVRSLCFISDAAEATARLGLAVAPGSAVNGQAVNIGRVDPVSMKQLADLMIHLSGHQAGTVDVPGERFFGPGFEEIPYRVPRVDRLRELIGFEAKVTLKEGLTEVLAHWGLLAPEEQRAPLPPTLLPAIRPQLEPDAALIGSIQRSLASGVVTNNGPEVIAFEKEIANFLGVEEAIAVSNGSDAISLVLRALGLRGKVVIPSYTYVATLNSVLWAGLEPVFCDIDPERFTLCPKALEALLRREGPIAAVMPVNVFGVHADLSELRAVTETYGTRLIYDNAHGFGSALNGQLAPRDVLAQTFSTHATKILPTVEGGLIVAHDPALSREIRRLRAHGLTPSLMDSTPGQNSKLDELRAAVGRHSLRLLPEVLRRRQEAGAAIRDYLVQHCDGAYRPQYIPDDVTPNFQNLGVYCRPSENHGMDAMRAALRRHGVEGRWYFHPALHRLEMFGGRFDLPQTDKTWRNVLCLPLYSRMSTSDITSIQHAAAAAARDLAQPT